MAQCHADQLAPKLLEYLAVRDKSLFEEAVRQLPAFDFPLPVSKAADELSTAESTLTSAKKKLAAVQQQMKRQKDKPLFEAITAKNRRGNSLFSTQLRILKS